MREEDVKEEGDLYISSNSVGKKNKQIYLI